MRQHLPSPPGASRLITVPPRRKPNLHHRSGPPLVLMFRSTTGHGPRSAVVARRRVDPVYRRAMWGDILTGRQHPSSGSTSGSVSGSLQTLQIVTMRLVSEQQEQQHGKYTRDGQASCCDVESRHERQDPKKLSN